MKFKDYTPDKMRKLKENGEYPFEDVENSSSGEVLIYKYDIGICSLLERLYDLIIKKHVGITIWSDYYFGNDEVWFGSAEEVIFLLEDKDINKIQAIKITESGVTYNEESSFDWCCIDYFTFYPKEQIIKKNSYVIKDFH